MSGSSQSTWRLGPPVALNTPPEPAQPKPVAATGPLRRAERACYDALGHALKEGNVFAAVTGPSGSGKTTVLEAVLADHASRSLRCIRIQDADRVSAMLARQIEAVAAQEADKPENQDRHIILAIDDAHGASEELLRCLARLAAMREPGRRVPQVLLAGLPDLWTRLAAAEYEPLRRRLAVRAVLPEVGQDEDPWESVEQDVRSTMATPKPNEVLAPGPAPEEAPFGSRRGQPGGARPAGYDADVAPPDLFALFPNAPPATPPRPASRRRSRLALLALVPVGCAMAAAIAFWAMDEWPDLHWNPLPQPRSTATAQFMSAPVVTEPPLSAPITIAPVAPVPPAPPAAASRPAERLPERPAERQAAPAAASSEAPAARSGIDTPPTATPAPAPVTAPPSVKAAAAMPPPAPAKPAPLSAATLAALLKRGEEQEGLGDISGARLLYERAAEQGDAVAALRLARSFDPAFLPAPDAATFADRAAAHDWYSRAAALGNKEAASRLQDWNRGP